MPTWTVYPKFKNALMQKQVDMDTDTFKVILTTSAVAPNPAHEDLADITNEVVGTGYARKATTGSLTLVGTTYTWELTDVIWLENAAGFTNARYIHIIQDTGVAATSVLILSGDLGADKGIATGDLSIDLSNGGFDF